MFNNGSGDQGSIPGWVLLKAQKMVLDATLPNTKHYKVWIKGKVEQYREKSSTPHHLGVAAIEKGAFRLPSTSVANLTTFYINTAINLTFNNEKASTLHKNLYLIYSVWIFDQPLFN